MSRGDLRRRVLSQPGCAEYAAFIYLLMEARPELGAEAAGVDRLRSHSAKTEHGRVRTGRGRVRRSRSGASRIPALVPLLGLGSWILADPDRSQHCSHCWGSPRCWVHPTVLIPADPGTGPTAGVHPTAGIPAGLGTGPTAGSTPLRGSSY